MDSHNAKTKAMMNAQQHGPGQQFIVLKDCLLYVQGNDSNNPGEPATPDIYPVATDHSLLGKQRVYALGSAPANALIPDLDELLARYRPPCWKKSFLVFKNPTYTTVQTAHIAFFYIRNNTVSLTCFNKQVYTLNQSLDQITNAVSPEQFFRVNRQYLVNFSAIREVELYFMRKLYVKLVIEAPDKLYINKEKTASFLSWMENR